MIKDFHPIFIQHRHRGRAFFSPSFSILFLPFCEGCESKKLPVIFHFLVGILFFVRSRRSPLRQRLTVNHLLNNLMKFVQDLMTDLG